MKKSILIVPLLLAIGWLSVVSAACPTAYPLFRIERSKNKNIVQYDICPPDNGSAPDPDPVKVYWILKNGRREDLNAIQAKFAYGIKSQEKLGGDKFRIVLVAMKDRNILVEKTTNGYRAVVTISGKESILEKVYVKSEENFVGFPTVNYIDLFGRTLETDAAVQERIIPE
jgi:hypothetical protein